MSVRERQIVLEPKFDCGTTACLHDAFARVFICTSTIVTFGTVPAFSYQEFVNYPKL